jgi:hypothetical protein
MIDFLGIKLQSPFSYVGIGPPATPDEVCGIFKDISRILSSEGGVLRSGGDEGGDAAFESQALAKEIYLPYRHYNKNLSGLHEVETACTEIAKSLHPAWHRCSEFAKKAHARHVYEVLGKKLDQPADVMICWTQDGAFEEEVLSGKSGILRTAISLALKHGIPVFNAGSSKHKKLLSDFVSGHAGGATILRSASGQGNSSQATVTNGPKRGFQTLRR